MIQSDSTSVASAPVAAPSMVPAADSSGLRMAAPVKSAEEPSRHVAPPVAVHSPIRISTPGDSVYVASDSVASDSIAEHHAYGITLTPPRIPEVEPNASLSWGMSYVLGGMFILFCIIGLRFRNNRKYVTMLLRNLVEVRVRNNLFDETVRETSFLVLLNLMWSCSAGIILYSILCYTIHIDPSDSFGIPALQSRAAVSTAICMGVGVAYTGFMALAYYLVGTVFSGSVYAKMWLKGYSASQGLLSFIYFPLALLFICYPQWVEPLLWVALGTFVLAKIVFIWKGFRIFFTQISSWVLFLYYLCSLEIVPLILTYLAATMLCGLLK